MPDKNFLNGAVKGNGITTGLTDGVKDYGLLNRSDTVDGSRLAMAETMYGTSVGVAYGNLTFATNKYTIGITTDPTKSGVICDNDLNIKYVIKY